MCKVNKVVNVMNSFQAKSLFSLLKRNSAIDRSTPNIIVHKAALPTRWTAALC